MRLPHRQCDRHCRGEATFETQIDGKVWTQDVFPYQAKCLAEIRAAYEALDASRRCKS